MNSQSTRLIITILPIGASYITPITRALFLILYRLTAITIPITGVYARRVLAGRGASLMPPGGTAAVNYRNRCRRRARAKNAACDLTKRCSEPRTARMLRFERMRRSILNRAVADLVSR